MQKYHLAKPVDDPIMNWFASLYNKFMYHLARKAAKNMCLSKNKAIYGIELYNSIHVMTSIEKRDIDKLMPKGNKMNIAKTLEHQSFIYTPEQLRKKSNSN